MIKTINESNSNEFENKINDLLDDGYKILSSSCGYVGEVGGSVYDCDYWMAVLAKQEDIK